MFEFIIGLVIIFLLIALSRLSESDCTGCNGNCNQGRNCKCKGKENE